MTIKRKEAISLPLVSILMNCRNGEKYLREAILSVFSQSYQNWEIIFWDNCSTDSSAKIFNEFHDERLRYFRAPEFTSLGKARNLAASNALGEWLAFLDCDDVWLPTKLEEQIDAAQKNNNAGLVYGHCLVIEGVGISSASWASRQLKYRVKTVLKTLPEGAVFTRLLKFNFIPLVTAIVPKKIFQEVGGVSVDLEQAEDYELFLKIANKYQVLAVQSVISLYRVHGENLSNENEHRGFEESIRIISAYLPDLAAKIAIRYAHSNRGLGLIRGGNLPSGLIMILKNGSLLDLISITRRKIFRVL